VSFENFYILHRATFSRDHSRFHRLKYTPGDDHVLNRIWIYVSYLCAICTGEGGWANIATANSQLRPSFDRRSLPILF
jgi:hypothetical protein